jgi:hypothetical protein
LIRHPEDGTIEFVQPHLIDSILKDLSLVEDSNTRTLPAVTTKVLHKYEDSPAHDENLFHYRSVVGKLSYLEKCTSPSMCTICI